MIDMYAYFRYQAAKAADEIRAIKEKSWKDGAKSFPGLFSAKDKASEALTCVALLKTYYEHVGEAFGEPVKCDLPARKDFKNFLFERKWKRNHAAMGKEKSTLWRAYRRIVKTQNRIKNGRPDGDYSPPWVKEHEEAMVWAQSRPARRNNA